MTDRWARIRCVLGLCVATACDGSRPASETDVDVSFARKDRCAGVTCRALDVCHVAGTCDSATGLCSNPVAPDGTACSDADACTTVDVCRSGACVGTSAVLCPAENPCQTAACDPTTGACVSAPLADGTICDDGDVCTEGDVCQAGACTGTIDPIACPAPAHSLLLENILFASVSGTITPSGWRSKPQSIETSHPYAQGIYRWTIDFGPEAERGRISFSAFDTAPGDRVRVYDSAGQEIAAYEGSLSAFVTPDIIGTSAEVELDARTDGAFSGFTIDRADVYHADPPWDVIRAGRWVSIPIADVSVDRTFGNGSFTIDSSRALATKVRLHFEDFNSAATVHVRDEMGESDLTYGGRLGAFVTPVIRGRGAVVIFDSAGASTPSTFRVVAIEAFVPEVDVLDPIRLRVTDRLDGGRDLTTEVGFEVLEGGAVIRDGGVLEATAPGIVRVRARWMTDGGVFESNTLAFEFTAADPTRLVSMDLAPHSHVVHVGDERCLQVTGHFGDKHTAPLADQVIFDVTGSAILSFDARGCFIALGEGSARIRAILEGVASQEAFVVARSLGDPDMVEQWVDVGGATIQLHDLVMTIPPGAVSTPRRLAIASLDKADLPPHDLLDPIADAVLIDGGEARFEIPASIVWSLQSVDPSDVESIPMAIHRGERWILEPASIDALTATARYETQNFSIIYMPKNPPRRPPAQAGVDAFAYYRQNPQNWCLISVTAMALQAYGKTRSPLPFVRRPYKRYDIAALLKVEGDTNFGITDGQADDILKAHGIETDPTWFSHVRVEVEAALRGGDIRRTAFAQQLMKLIAEGYAVILSNDVYRHSIIVLGYDAERVYYHDPSDVVEGSGGTGAIYGSISWPNFLKFMRPKSLLNLGNIGSLTALKTPLPPQPVATIDIADTRVIFQTEIRDKGTGDVTGLASIDLKVGDKVDPFTFGYSYKGKAPPFVARGAGASWIPTDLGWALLPITRVPFRPFTLYGVSSGEVLTSVVVQDPGGQEVYRRSTMLPIVKGQKKSADVSFPTLDDQADWRTRGVYELSVHVADATGARPPDAASIVFAYLPTIAVRGRAFYTDKVTPAPGVRVRVTGSGDEPLFDKDGRPAEVTTLADGRFVITDLDVSTLPGEPGTRPRIRVVAVDSSGGTFPGFRFDQDIETDSPAEAEVRVGAVIDFGDLQFLPQPAVLVSPTSGLVTTEAGGAATFSVSLSAAPGADVVIPIRSSAPDEGVASPEILTFTGDNWSIPQTVRVTGVLDTIEDGDQVYSLVLEPAVSSGPFNGIDPPDVSVTNLSQPWSDHIVFAVSFDFSGSPISQYDLFMIHGDGSGLVNITTTPDPIHETQPVLSPDGTRLAFAESTASGDYPSLRVMSVYGSQRMSFDLVLPVVASLEQGQVLRYISWAPDNERLAIVVGSASDLIQRRGQIHILDLRTSTLSPSITPLGGGNPSWSPDGSKIAFASDGNLFVVNPDGSNLVQLTAPRQGSVWYGGASWSPDGSKMAFINSVYSQSSGTWEDAVFTMNVDGSNRAQMTPYFLRACNVAWSPDGAKLLFHRVANLVEAQAGGPGGWLVVINATKAGRTLQSGLEVGLQGAVTAHWSPEGTRIALMAPSGDVIPIVDSEGNPRDPLKLFKLYTMNADGSNLAPRTPNFFWRLGMSWR